MAEGPTPEGIALGAEFENIHANANRTSDITGPQVVWLSSAEGCYFIIHGGSPRRLWEQLTPREQRSIERTLAVAAMLQLRPRSLGYRAIYGGLHLNFPPKRWEDLDLAEKSAFTRSLAEALAMRDGHPDHAYAAAQCASRFPAWRDLTPASRAEFEKNLAEAAALPRDAAAARYAALHGNAPKIPWGGLGATDQVRFARAFVATAADVENTRLWRYRAAVHGLPDAGQTALCLSGGGIRSAAFALGVLQGLAQLGLLRQFHYLSTVSGGGYIGGWLSAWAGRAARADPPWQMSFVGVEAELGGQGAPGPLRDLRQRRAFLTPKTGFASPDTWAAVAHVVRNLLLNWLVFLPLLAALLLLPRVFEAGLLAFTHSKDLSDRRGASLEELLYRVFRFTAEAMHRAPVAWLQHQADWLDRHLPAPVPSSGPRFWLDTLAFAFVLLGLAFSMVNRTTVGKGAIGDQGFAWRVLLPVVVGALLLLLAICSWMSGGWYVQDDMLGLWCWLCAIAFPIIRVAALVWIKVFRRAEAERGQFRLWTVLGDLAAEALAGGVVGLVAWSGLWLRNTLTGTGMLDLRDIVVFGAPWLLLALLGGQILYSGLTSRIMRTSGERNREWLARASGWYSAAATGWIIFSGAALYGWSVFQWASGLLPVLTLGSGAVSLTAGAGPFTKAVATKAGGKPRLTTVVSVFSLVFLLCLCAWIAHATAVLLDALAKGRRMPHLFKQHGDEPWREIVAGLAMEQLSWLAFATAMLFVCAALASFFVNVNYFSLNALYRNRLVRAFLGASNLKDVTGKEPARNPFDNFAGRDTPDNPGMDASWAGPGQPFPVINIALNLTSTKENAWQERKAAAFTVTPLHAGGAMVGYRPIDRYAHGLTLGTAMSISGAAVSPNWGYHSSPLTSFLLTLFNLRLGSWLGNPARHLWKSDGPGFGLSLFWQEALGRTSERHSYVYLSDGGHFENLGLYEMVRRRCRVIVVSDAGADPDCALEDLGNALRKIAVDLSVRIDFKAIDMGRRGADPANPGVYCAVGTIKYPEAGAAEGKLVYIKAGLYGTLPAEVRAYAAANAKFPHDTTLNQWFTESQFESYRALGRHAVEQAAGRGAATPPVQGPSDLLQFVQTTEHYISGSSAPPPTRVRVVP